MIFSSWRILICVCSWIFNSYLNWYFVLRTVWVSNHNCRVFFTCSCCIYWCLVFKCSTTWKVGNVTDRVLGIWCVAKVNRLILSCWRILIRIRTWIFNCYLNWDFIFRTIWVGNHNCCVFVTCSCCIDWCLIFKACSCWKV